MSYTATWTRLSQGDQLKRSSHCASVVGSDLYLFGGELKPRQPRDNDVHKISLTTTPSPSPTTLPAPPLSPSARVGSASTTHKGRIYLFSGRGGEAMAPIDEAGALWVFDPAENSWKAVTPAEGSEIPSAPSYHALASDPATDTLYLHAGCPAAGRLADFWAFDVQTATWRQLAGAPAPARGGASLAVAGGRVYRMNGFDGEREQGGALDVYAPAEDRWATVGFVADGVQGPGARSVGVLVPVKVRGEMVLVTVFGESDPSALGHQGAGKMLADGWVYGVESGKWVRLAFGTVDVPEARGWFDADCVSIGGKDYVAIVGGLGESNERLDDAWLLSIA